jgi:hypothetical protein
MTMRILSCCLLIVWPGGSYAVLVRRQLSSANHDSTASLASIGEEPEDHNADLMNRTETGRHPNSPRNSSHWCSLLLSTLLCLDRQACRAGCAGALVDDLIGGLVSDSVGRAYSGRLGPSNKGAQKTANGNLMDT